MVHTQRAPRRLPKLVFQQPINLQGAPQNRLSMSVVGYPAWNRFWRTGLIAEDDVNALTNIRNGKATQSDIHFVNMRIGMERQRHQQEFKNYLVTLRAQGKAPKSKFDFLKARLDYMMSQEDVRSGLLRSFDASSPPIKELDARTSRPVRRYQIQGSALSGNESIVYPVQEQPIQNGRPVRSSRQGASHVVKFYTYKASRPLVTQGPERLRREQSLNQQFPGFALQHRVYAGYPSAASANSTLPAIAGVQEVIPPGYVAGSQLPLSQLKQVYAHLGKRLQQFRGGFNFTRDLHPNNFVVNPGNLNDIRLFDLSPDPEVSDVIRRMGPFTQLRFSDDDLRGYLPEANRYR